MRFITKKKNSGFTLIELLVTLAVTVLLASVVYSNVSGALTRSRDSERRATLAKIALALEYYRDQNGAYPNTGSTWFSSETGDVASNNGGNWIPNLAPVYYPALPNDPLGGSSTNSVCKPGGWQRSYLYMSDGKDYALLSHCGMENPWTCNSPQLATQSNDRYCDLNRTTWALKVCSPGGCSW